MAEPVTFASLKELIPHHSLGDFGSKCYPDCERCLLESLEQRVRELRTRCKEMSALCGAEHERQCLCYKAYNSFVQGMTALLGGQ